MEQITGLPREPGPARYYQLHMQQGNVSEASLSLSLSPCIAAVFLPSFSHNLSFSQAIRFPPLSLYNCQCRWATEHLSTQEGQQLRDSQEQIKTKQGSNTGERHFCRGSCTVIKNGGQNSQQMGLWFC